MLASLARFEKEKKQKTKTAGEMRKLNDIYESLRYWIVFDGTVEKYAKNNESAITRAAALDNETHCLLFGYPLQLPVFEPGKRKRKCATQLFPGLVV